MVHLLDTIGADVNQGVGKHQNTPLMTATGRWNVRIIDYLIERGADPTKVDVYGFSARRKAEIKNLKTISSMLKQHETKFLDQEEKNLAITNARWKAIIASRNLNILNFKPVSIIRPNNSSVVNFSPSKIMKREGSYPFQNMDDNQDIFCLFSGISGNNEFIDSSDHIRV